MNFHISPFSPLRPQFASSSSNHGSSSNSARNSAQHDLSGHDFDSSSGPVRIAVDSPDADDELTNSRGLLDEDVDDDDDDDDDEDTDSDISADDVTQDSRDVLVQRLNDLADRLSGANTFRASSIEALHRQVDSMERELSGRDRSTSRHSTLSARRRLGSHHSGGGGSTPKSLQLPSPRQFGRHQRQHDEPPRGRDSGLGIMAPISPSWFMSRFQRQSSQPAPAAQDDKGTKGAVSTDNASSPSPSPSPLPQQQQHHHQQQAGTQPSGARPPPVKRVESMDAGTNTSPPRISSEDADSVVKEAEKLCREMAMVIESLRARREESDHINALLLEREKVANRRLLEAAAAAGELADVVADNEAELRHLRLELRAIEVQCMGYVPRGADPELRQSIRNWRDDWKQLREQFASRRGTSFVSEDESGTASALASPTEH